MANRSDRDDLHAPPLFKTFAGGTLRVLESTDAPANAQHLPCQLAVQISAVNQHLDVKDGNGVVNSIVFALTGVFVLRMAPLTIEASSTAAFVTVFWQPMPRVG